MRWSFRPPNQGSIKAAALPNRTVPYIIVPMAKPDSAETNAPAPVANPTTKPEADAGKKRPREIGGPSGLEPTRYGDWERNGRVSDF
jgi:hypothetical protein